MVEPILAKSAAGMTVAVFYYLALHEKCKRAIIRVRLRLVHLHHSTQKSFDLHSLTSSGRDLL